MKLNYQTPEKKVKIPEMGFSIPSFRLSWIHLVAVLAIFMWFKSCTEASDLKNELTSYNEVKSDTIKYYETKLGEEVATRKSYEGSKATLELLLNDSQDSINQWKRLANYYKNVKAASKAETITSIDSLKVDYVIPGEFFNIPFDINEQYYSINGRSTNTGLFLDQIRIPNTQSIVIGDKKKKGLFSFKTETRIDVINSNPYVKTTNVDGFVLKQRSKKIGVGLFAGYGFGKGGLSPILGVGVQYNLITF